MEHTLTFPVDNVDASTTLQIIISMHSTSGSGDVGYTATTQNVWLDSYGELEWRYDLDNPVIVPGKMKFSFVDPDNWLANYFFARGETYDLFQVYNSTLTLNLNSSLEFSGNIVVDSVAFNTTTKILSFEVVSMVEIINNKVIFLDDDTPVNPFSYNNNGNGYTDNALDPTIFTMIEDIYQQVNGSISLSFIHNMLLRTIASSPSYNIDLEDIHFNPYEIYFHNIKTANYNTGGVLRRLAFEFIAYTGLINKDECFFKELFVYDSATAQSVSVLDKIRTIAYPHYEFIRITTNTATTPQVQEYGDEELAGADKKFTKESFTQWGIPWHLNTADNVTGRYNPYLGTNPIDFNYYVGESLWRNRSFHRHNNLVSEFKFSGVDYNINQDFTENSIEHNILSMKKNYDTLTTVVRALELR